MESSKPVEGSFGHLVLNSDGTWTCDEDSVICITLEDGRNYYASAWTMGGEGYVWLLLELEECMVWLVDGRLMV